MFRTPRYKSPVIVERNIHTRKTIEIESVKLTRGKPLK